MLTIEHYVGPSSIHGLGVFASGYIKRGALVWKFHPVIDRVISEDLLASLPPHVIDKVRTHAEYMPDAGHYILACDGDYFMNHADKPSLFDSGSVMYAARDIAPGEELTCNYRIVRVVAFDPDAQAVTSDILSCEPDVDGLPLRA